jgi:hypothetical protein
MAGRCYTYYLALFHLKAQQRLRFQQASEHATATTGTSLLLTALLLWSLTLLCISSSSVVDVTL